MTSSCDMDYFGRRPTLWTATVVTWVLENPEFKQEQLLGYKIEGDPAPEREQTRELESVEVPDLDQVIAAAHQLLDRHAEHVGEYGLEVYIIPPQLPHPEQERLGIRHYRLTPDARKQAQSIGIRGRDAEARVARMVRHADPCDHQIANRRFGGVLMKVEDGIVSWIGLLNQRRRTRTR